MVTVSDAAHQLMKRFRNFLGSSQAFILRRGYEACSWRVSRVEGSGVIGQIVCLSYSREQSAVLSMLKSWNSSISANCNSSADNHFLSCVLSSLRVDYKCSLKLKAIPYKGQKKKVHALHTAATAVQCYIKSIWSQRAGNGSALVSTWQRFNLHPTGPWITILKWLNYLNTATALNL